jgi:Flp pilus assembly protein TadG
MRVNAKSFLRPGRKRLILPGFTKLIRISNQARTTQMPGNLNPAARGEWDNPLKSGFWEWRDRGQNPAIRKAKTEDPMIAWLSKFLRLRRLAPRSRARRGATAVEMALIAPVFFLLLMGVTEITLLLTAQMMLENAAYNTSRLAKTGYVLTGQNQMQTVSQTMDNELQSFGSLINTANVVLTATTYNSFAAIGSGGTTGLGSAQQIVVYTITYPWALFTPMLKDLIGTNGVVNLTARIVVRNEPY